MGVDYTPTFGTYKMTGSFRFWCQKVLPLVYDDSLSYYELLCKVVGYLNNVVENVDTLNGNIDALKDAYELLQEYVNSYFDSLDVQTEINNKLDDMAGDGSLAVILDPIISEEVAAWLAQHITPTTPAIDNTMTVSGAAADAAAVGTLFNRTVTFRKELTGGEDMDTLAQAGFYYKQYNVAISNGVNNNPAKIVTFSRPLAGTIGAAQIWFDVAANKMYFRTRRTEEDAWGAWSTFADQEEALTFRDQLIQGQNVDDIIQAGYYYTVANRQLVNAPNDRQAKLVSFSRPSAGKIGAAQLWFDVNQNRLYFRTNLSANTDFSNWKEVKAYDALRNTHAECYAAFIKEMKRIANQIGCSADTVITSPNGNYATMSTARDMLRVLLYAWGFEEISRIWSTYTRSFKTSIGEKSLTSTMFNSAYTAGAPIVGGKPGIIGATETRDLVANLCMISLLDPESATPRYGAGVVMGAKSDAKRFSEMSKLMAGMKAGTAFNDISFDSDYIIGAYAYAGGKGSFNSEQFPLGVAYGEKAADTQFPTASTVKILTAITVMTHAADLDDLVTICPADVTTGSGNIFVSGEVVTVRDLLYSLLMISSNTAAVALAHYIGDKLLNRKIIDKPEEP